MSVLPSRCTKYIAEWTSTVPLVSLAADSCTSSPCDRSVVFPMPNKICREMTITAALVERGYDHATPPTSFNGRVSRNGFSLSKKVPIAHPLTGLLCIVLRSAIPEWPQTVWGPVEHCFGFVCQGFGLRIIRKLVGIVGWYFDYHAATISSQKYKRNS